MKRNYKVSKSNLQANIFLDGSPVEDIGIEKGSTYLFEAENPDECFWLTYNKDDTDLELEVSGKRKNCLFETNVVEPNKDGMSLALRYMPDLVCIQESMTEEDLGDYPVCFFETFDLHDFLTGNVIVGEDSGARASITEFGSDCDETGRKLLVNMKSVIGEFIPGERIRVEGKDISTERIRAKFSEDLYRFSKAPKFIQNILENAEFPYVVADEIEQAQKDCGLGNFRSYEPYAVVIEEDGRYIYEEPIDASDCESGAVKKTMTLKYSPDMLPFFCELGSDTTGLWDDAKNYDLASFPFKDFLTGQTIRGWYSNTFAKIVSTRLKVRGCERFVVVELENPTGDFQTQEPIEITTIRPKEIWVEWRQHASRYADAPGFMDVLETLTRQPFYTTDRVDNFFCSGEADKVLSDLTVELMTEDGCVLDENYYSLGLEVMNDYMRDCGDTCIYYPSGLILLCITFTPDIDPGTKLWIKRQAVDYAIGNGTNKIELTIPPEERECYIYLNDGRYTRTPVRMEILQLTVGSFSNRLEGLIPFEIICEFPQYYEFMKLYFEYAESFGQGGWFFNNSDLVDNPECAPKMFLPTIAKEVLGPFDCREELVCSPNFQQAFPAFWNNNASKAGIEWLFRMVFDKEVEICDPCDKSFTASGMDLKTSEFIWIINSASTLCSQEVQLFCEWEDSLADELLKVPDVDFFKVGETIRGVSSNTTALVESIQKFTNKDGVIFHKVEISHPSAQFLGNEKLVPADRAEFLDDKQQAEYIAEVENELDGFQENLRKFGVFPIVVPDILLEIEITDQTGEWCPYEELEVLTPPGCWQNKVYVECIDEDMKAITIGIRNCDGPPNYNFPNGSIVKLQRRNFRGRVTGTIEGIAKSGVHWIHEEGYTNNSSLTDSVVVLNDNLTTSPQAYILSVPLSRKDYFEIFNKTSREAGSYVISEYPLTLYLNQGRIPETYGEVTQEDDPCLWVEIVGPGSTVGRTNYNTLLQPQ